MTKKLWLQGAVATGLLTVGAFAQACTLGAWLAGSTGNIVDGGPDEGGLPRYSGECSAQSIGAGHVQDNSPAGEPRMISRFYFLADGTGTATIFKALADAPAVDAAGTSIYEVVYDGAAETITVNSLAAGGGSTGPLDVSGSPGWTSVEVDWESDGTMQVWVNTDAKTEPTATGSAAAGTGAINAARLGPQDVAGTLTVTIDDYEGRRTTAVGRLLACDANNNGALTVGDAVTVLIELTPTGALAKGPADCNENGAITVGDAVSILLKL